MINTNAVYTPKVVNDLSTPVYRPPAVNTNLISNPQFIVDNMYLTKQDTEEGITNWYLNVVNNYGQEFIYRLDVHYSR